MQWLAELCVKRPVFAWVLILSLVTIGLFAFTRLGVDRFPNVDIPSVSITTRLPGAAPDRYPSLDASAVRAVRAALDSLAQP